jgi:hypothetical protein
MLIGFALAYLFYIRNPRLPEEARRQHPAALQVPAQQVVLRRALRLHLRAAGHVARPLPVEEGRRLVIDGFGPTASRRASSTSPPARRRLQTGYLYHYAFAMLIGVPRSCHLDHLPGGTLMSGLAHSFRRHLPAAGRRAVHPVDPRRGRGARATSRWSRCGRRSSPSRCRSDLGLNFDTSQTPASSSSRTTLAGSVGIGYKHGRRRHLHACSSC